MKMNNIISLPIIMVFVGALLTATGGLWVAIKANQGKINALKEQKAFEEKLNSKNEEIIKLNNKVFQYTVGGDNYPLIFDAIDHNNSKCDFTISNYRSKEPLPLYDVHVLVIDLDKKKSVEERKDLTIMQQMNLMEQEVFKRIDVGYLSGVSGAKHIFSASLPPKSEERNFEIQISARNTAIKQYITIYYDSEYKRYHTKSKAEQNGIELFNSYK
jgi:hypothetical protein